MLDSINVFLEKGVVYIKVHPQLLMTILLVVVVPFAFLFSGQQFLNAAKQNQETLEKDRIGLFHDLFASYMRGVSFDASSIQGEIEKISAQNPDITKFKIGVEEGNQIRIIAALDRDSVGIPVPDEDAASYRIGNININESIIAPRSSSSGVRYWQGFRLVRIESHPDYYIFTETSLEHIDQLFAERIIRAYYWLIGLILVIVYLLVRHVRLIDYSYLYRETKKANEMKDLFTNMIAHELRTPLTAIRGYASIIKENESLDETTRTQAKNIEDSSSRLVALISDLLDVARIQSGKLSVSKSKVMVTNLAASAMDSLRPIAEAKNISLRFDRPTADIFAIADEKRLYQVLVNVLSNAIKYTERGSIETSIENKIDRVEIRVKDTGMGIASEHQNKLFAPFFRIDDKKSETIVGTGLGMWITKQLVELMGGSIGIESIRGVGTHVVITLHTH